MAEATTSPELITGAELVSNVQRTVENAVSGVPFEEKDSVFRTYIKQYDSITAAMGEQGKTPNFWENVMAHINAGGKQVEFMAKDGLYWALRGGALGSGLRFVGEHLPLVGGVFRNIDKATDSVFKPSEREKQRVRDFAVLRTIGLKAENRINGTVNWIMGRK